MPSSSVSESFSDMPLWMVDEDSIDLKHEDMIYSSSDMSTRTSMSSHDINGLDMSDQQHIQNPYLYHAPNMKSPQETPNQYHLPSPLEEDILLDPILVDKERRREQNRVAQRAFRERKECRLKQLEKKITELRASQRHLEKKYQNLRTAHLRLQSGLKILLDASGTFDDLEPELSALEEDGKD